MHGKNADLGDNDPASVSPNVVEHRRITKFTQNFAASGGHFFRNKLSYKSQSFIPWTLSSVIATRIQASPFSGIEILTLDVQKWSIPTRTRRRPCPRLDDPMPTHEQRLASHPHRRARGALCDIHPSPLPAGSEKEAETEMTNVHLENPSDRSR
jgi:hypothetical protein